MKPLDEIVDQILNEAPSSETLLLLLKERKAEGRLNEVIRECIRALERYPRDVRIRGLLAETCFESGWLTRAEAEVESATARIEELVPLYKLKARVYTALKRSEEAARCLKIYLAHDPGDTESLALLEDLKPPAEKAAPQEPIESLEETLEEPSSPLPEIATPTLAELYFAQGQIQEAVSTYRKILSQNPEAVQFKARMEELTAMISPAPREQSPIPREQDEAQEAEEDQKAERSRKKREKMIHVLESWREALREPLKTGMGE